MKDGWLNAGQLLDILKISYSALLKQVNRNKFTKVKYVKSTTRGGHAGRRPLIHISDPAIPAEARERWLSENSLQPLAVSNQSEALAKPPILEKDLKHLKQWQRDVMDSRLFVLDAVQRLAGGDIRRFVEQAQAGGLEGHVLRRMQTANHRDGGKRVISPATIYRWRQAYAERGLAGLVPADPEALVKAPVWLPEFLEFYRLQGKPSVPQAIEAWMRYQQQKGIEKNLPHPMTVRRTIKKMSVVDLQRGRMSGSELKGIRGYCIRDKGKLEPLDVGVMDGHSFKSKVINPFSGNPFNPELEGVVDAVTRVLLGFSAGLAESSQVVADAIRHSVQVSEEKPLGGICAIYYADCGAGNKSRYIADEVTGVVTRLGAELTHSIPGNPQARGLIERAIGSIWVRAARELPLYHGKGADSLTLKRNLKIVEKDIKEKGHSPLIHSWQQFLDFISDTQRNYNNRPHSGLPKIMDRGTGFKRHMTPAELWQEFVGRGWHPYTMSVEEARELFMPHVAVTVRRGMVRVRGQSYYHKELEHWHGQRVIACYDVHDGKQVWVNELKGRHICTAAFEGNKRDMFPVSYVEQAKKKRLANRLRTLENKREEILSEYKGVIEVKQDKKEEETLLDILPEECRDLETPIFTSEWEKEEWENDNSRRVSERRANGD